MRVGRRVAAWGNTTFRLPGDPAADREPETEPFAICQMKIAYAESLGRIRGASHNLPTPEQNSKRNRPADGAIDKGQEAQNIRGLRPSRHIAPIPREVRPDGLYLTLTGLDSTAQLCRLLGGPEIARGPNPIRETVALKSVSAFLASNQPRDNDNHQRDPRYVRLGRIATDDYRGFHLLWPRRACLTHPACCAIR
jgi:hypothetical protein